MGGGVIFGPGMLFDFTGIIGSHEDFFGVLIFAPFKSSLSF